MATWDVWVITGDRPNICSPPRFRTLQDILMHPAAVCWRWGCCQHGSAVIWPPEYAIFLGLNTQAKKAEAYNSVHHHFCTELKDRHKQKLNCWLFHFGLEMNWSGLIYIYKMNIRLSNSSSEGHKRLWMLESDAEIGEQLLRQQRKSAAEDLDWNLSSGLIYQPVHNLNMHAGTKVRVRDAMHVQIVHILINTLVQETQVCLRLVTVCVYEQTSSRRVTNAWLFWNPFLRLS